MEAKIIRKIIVAIICGVAAVILAVIAAGCADGTATVGMMAKLVIPGGLLGIIAVTELITAEQLANAE